MKIAVLSINIGEYDLFWDEFYNSAEKNFFPNDEKTYFVFTDKGTEGRFIKKNVIVVSQSNLGWPMNTMKRFDMFNRLDEDLCNFDYVFFANANSIFTQKIDSRILNKSKDIITVEHPGFHYKNIYEKPFERNEESLAYVSVNDGKFYVQGAFYGGKSKSFIEMIKELNQKTETDLSNGIIAIWHDESFLNMYVANNKDKVQVLGWQYLYFEEYVLPYNPVIVLRNKRKYLTNKNGRFSGQSFMKERFLIMCRNVKWFFYIKIGRIKKCNNIENNVYYATDINN